MKRVLIVGTADTKGEELAFLRKQVEAAGARAIVVDVGVMEPQCEVDVTRHRVAACANGDILGGRDRGQAVAGMGGGWEIAVVCATPRRPRRARRCRRSRGPPPRPGADPGINEPLFEALIAPLTFQRVDRILAAITRIELPDQRRNDGGLVLLHQIP